MDEKFIETGTDAHASETLNAWWTMLTYPKFVRNCRGDIESAKLLIQRGADTQTTYEVSEQV